MLPRDNTLRHLFSVAVGTGLAYFSYGGEAAHPLLAMLATWLIMKVGEMAKMRKAAALLSFVFNLGYLLVCYFYVSSPDSYDVDFTMPMCTLTLRLIGTSIDLFDGGKAADKVSADQAKTRLATTPGLLEFLGYGYFFPIHFVGPVCSFKRYQDFVSGALYVKEKNGKLPSPALASVTSFAIGAFYMAFHLVVGSKFPTMAMVDPAFGDNSLPYRWAYMWVCGNVVMMKYFGVWSIGNGAIQLVGLGYNGRDAQGNAKHDALTSVRPLGYHFSTTLAGVVDSFNLPTNAWTKQHIFKRMAFLGNKEASALTALMFLAIWHGFSAGYFLAFGLEFLDMAAERMAVKRFAAFTEAARNGNALVKWAWISTAWLIRTTALHYGVLAFDLLLWERSMTAYAQVHFVPHILLALLFAYLVFVPAAKSDKKKKQ